MKYFLSGFPPPEKMVSEIKGSYMPDFREVNGHIHTPYSFSAFDELETALKMAESEKIAVLGINDFYVTDGYEAFHNGCLAHNIFPLFNLEFIGLLKDEQKRGVRINDPNNPGRIYFSGKGLDYPFNVGFLQKIQLNGVIKESQEQIKAIIAKLNQLIIKVNPNEILSYDTVRRDFAQELVRERHVARALRVKAEKSYDDPQKQITFIENLYGKKSKVGMNHAAALENEIRTNLLKSGGAAFVEEDEKAFLELNKIIKIIIKAGGIPCYPVLLDDASGNITEFESNPERLYHSLKKLGVECIELIPERNNISVLRDFVHFFHERGFIITFGTEHNTPEMKNMQVTARDSVMLDEYLKGIAWEGACVIAAHQYLRAGGRQGYVLPDGSHSIKQKKQLASLGRYVIEYYLNRKHEARNK